MTPINWLYTVDALFFPHDMLYASKIHCNLVSILVLVKLGFSLNFYNASVDLYLGTSYYGFGFFLDIFIVLDVDCGNINIYYSLFKSLNSYDNDVNICHARLDHIS